MPAASPCSAAQGACIYGHDQHMFRSLRALLDEPTPVLAPLALDPLMARLAEQAGFRAVYLGGGGLGYAKTFLEANLDLSEMARTGTEIASVTEVPIILDGACGWGDPMHLRRTIALAEAAGFAAIEIEDQEFPKRAGHHVGEDRIVSEELMAEKIRAAVAARRQPDFLIIARTNAAEPDEALRRGEAYRAAGADVLIPIVGARPDPEVVAGVGERLGPPLMFLAPPGGLATVDVRLEDLHAAGFRIVTDAMSLHLLVYAVLKAGYTELAGNGFQIQAPRDWWQILEELHETIDLDALLATERGTAERR
jgi:2-methylisocitrate lyase-like PEP mutase family enzyme